MKVTIALTMLVLSSLIWTIGCGKKEPSTKTNIVPREQVNVPVTKVSLGAMERFYEATGTVKAKTTTQVSSNLMGRIVSFPAAEGDAVGRGQVLVEIDNRENQAQLQKAQAGLREASAALTEIDRTAEAAVASVRTAESNKLLAAQTFARFKELYARRSASGQEFDEAQARLTSADSELVRAKANVQTVLSRKPQVNARIDQARADIANTKVYEGYRRIVSPVSGVVVKKFAESGAIASPGVPLLSIEDNSQYLLEVGVEETQSRLVRLGSRVNVRIDALGQAELFGTVAEILPSSDAASRTSTVKIALPASPLLKSGLYGLARFPVQQMQAITIPQTALVERGQLSGVYIVGADGIAQFRLVTTGKSSDGYVEILSGVSEGDDIVAANTAALSDGVKVR